MANANTKTNNTASTVVITGKGRLSYAYIWEPHLSEDSDSGEAKYSTSFLFPKTDKETVAKIKAAINAAIEQGIKKSWGGKRPANLKLPIRDGDKEADEKGEEYQGNYFFNASTKKAPGIVDQKRRTVVDEDEVYSGCYARISVNFYAFNKNGNKGIAVGLNNIQKWADGEPLGTARSKAEDDFDALETDDASGDLPFGEDPTNGGMYDEDGDLPFGEADEFAA